MTVAVASREMCTRSRAAAQRIPGTGTSVSASLTWMSADSRLKRTRASSPPPATIGQVFDGRRSEFQVTMPARHGRIRLAKPVEHERKNPGGGANRHDRRYICGGALLFT